MCRCLIAERCDPERADCRLRGDSAPFSSDLVERLRAGAAELRVVGLVRDATLMDEAAAEIELLAMTS